MKIKYVFQQFYLCKRLQNKLKWYSQIVVKVESRTGCNRHLFFNLASLLSVIEMNYASFFSCLSFHSDIEFLREKNNVMAFEIFVTPLNVTLIVHIYAVVPLAVNRWPMTT